MESLTNDSIVIISNFVACKHEEGFEWGNETKFKIGDVVYYIGEFKNENTTQDYISWFVKFENKNGDVFSASQLYFLTLDEWNDILKYAKSEKC